MCIMLIMNTKDQENLVILCQPMREKRVQNSGLEVYQRIASIVTPKTASKTVTA